MDIAMMYEIVGYVASVLVAISLMMKSILRLRVINLIGAAFFSLYGFLIGAFPVAVLNFIIVLIDIYYLYEMYATKEYFKLLEVKTTSDYLQYFLKFYQRDIDQFLPHFRYDPAPPQMIFFVLRNLVPAGLFIAQQQPDGTLMINLDFVIPGFRDFKIGEFVYDNNATIFTQRGFRQLQSHPGNATHEKYLRRMGFQPNDKGMYVKAIG